jgi:hypothetical protein
MTRLDVDLHGRVRLRLVDPPAAAVAAVTADTGLRPGPPMGEAADIEVTWVPDLALGGPLRRVGRDAGFTGDEFVLGAGPGSRTALPLDGLDGPMTMRCEPDVAALPHLMSLLNLAMLRSGALPLHGSAVVAGGRGTVATGWSKGGKTEIVLGLMAAGATFVADEWCYLVPGTGRVLGLRHPVRVWDWQLRQLPAVRTTLTRKQRLRLGISRPLARTGALRATLEPTLGISAAPEQLFGAARLADEGPFDELVLVESWDADHIGSRAVDPHEVTSRMLASLRAERADLAADVERFAFAFPARATDALDRAAARERVLLDEAFSTVPARLVSHPYPVDLDALARVVAQDA